MSALGGLDHEQALSAPSSAASAELLQQLEGFLVRTEIGLAEQGVGPNDGYQRKPLEIKTFRDDLRAHEDVDFPFFEAVQEVSCIAGLLGGIAVQPGNLGLREEFPGFFFDFLGPGAQGNQFSATAGTVARVGLAVAAIMAHHPPRILVPA